MKKSSRKVNTKKLKQQSNDLEKGSSSGRISTKDLILSAAEKILKRTGIQGLNQNAVARLVGIPQGQLTYHFKKRSDLMIALSESMLEGISDFIWSKRIDLQGKTFDTLLKMTIKILASKERTRALLGLIVEGDETPEVREKLQAQKERGDILISKVFGLPIDAPEVAAVKASLIGYAVLFYLCKDAGEEALLEQKIRANSNLLIKVISGGRKKV